MNAPDVRNISLYAAGDSAGHCRLIVHLHVLLLLKADDSAGVLALCTQAAAGKIKVACACLHAGLAEQHS